MQSKLAATIGLAVLLAAPAAMAQNGGTSGQKRGLHQPPTQPARAPSLQKSDR